MWGVVVGALLVIAGVALVIHGSYSLDAQRERHEALLFSSVLSSFTSVENTSSSSSSASSSISATSADDQATAFLSSATFGYAMDTPVYTSFYLLNLTNTEDVLSGEAQPQLQQVGPITYEKRSRKINVQFEAVPFQPTSLPYGYVRYQVLSSYHFVPERSNGTESDRIVTVNATYARRLQKLRSRGYSERLMLAEFAQQHVQEYTRHLQQEFLAETKLRAWSHFLPALVRHVQQEVLPAVIKRQQQQIDTSSIPSNLVHMYAVTRTEMIPQVLGDIYKDISDQFLPEIMQNNLDNALQQALPRVLENLYTRLQVESVPFFLQKQLASQQMRNVPRTLASLALKIDSVAFPYVLQEVYDRACLEAVPSILRTIKTEIIAQDIANNRVSVDIAQRNVMENWRKQEATPTNFDSWIDDTPTGKARTGFELLPSSPSLQLSVEAATLVLGSKATNKRFSIVDYDPQLAASYPLDQPTTTPEGFAIWKQVIAMDETAIAYVLQGVNNDVGRVSDFLTRDQLLFIRQYLINWAQSAITQRDRERFWRQSYTKRTTNTDINEPSVDIDIERTSVQTGFNIQSGKASTSGITAAIAQQLWNSSSEFAFTNPQGFTKWQDAIGSLASASSVQDLLSGITGLTLAHVAEVVSWIQKLLQDGFINRRALRHWSDGTCTSVLRLPLSECLLYDLEPSIAGNQTGFEMNPSSDPTWQVTQAVRELLWDRTKPASFLVPTHPSNTDLGFGIWLQGIRSLNFARVVDKIRQPSLTEANSVAIASWLKSWSMNELNVLNVYNWWRLSTCWPRRELSVTTPSSATSTMQSTCVKLYREMESSSVVTSTDSQSPYFTFEKTYHVTDDKCVWDATTKTYTRTSSTYDIKAQVFSCDTISTSLANDLDESTLGFELMPAATSASDRISLAAASALWNPSSPFSFVHEQGYKQWFTLNALDSASLLQAINTEIGAVCPTLSGGGDRSGIFNETLAGVSCDVLSQSHFEDIQAWVRSQSSSEWIQNTLLDQWRRGIADELEIEPYRGGDQRGWELTTGCSSSHCVLTEDSGLIYQIPRSALSLWTLDHSATFLTSDGYSIWAALSNATRFADAIAIKAAKDDIIAACKQSKWESWMQHAYEWLEAWKSNDHLFRDVLGHWMHAQCPTTPHLVSVIQRQPDAVTTTASCPPPEARYIVALKEAITDLQRTASRPAEFFRADIVETSAFVQPKKVVEVAETWIACEALDLTSFKQTVSFQTSLKEFQACNFLDVLANTTLEELADAGSVFQPLSVTPVEATFEMNRSTSADISIEIAQQIWDQSTPFGFTNLSVFLEKWHPAMNNLDLLAVIHSDLIGTTHTAPATSDLMAVQEYLAMWESSAISTRGVGIAWLSQNISAAIDLDAHTDGVQGGFELHSSTGWRSLGGDKLPSFDQGQYLWRAANTFSFLHTNDDARNDGLPTGFNAWKEIYEGVDWSSEQLVDKYPLEAKVHINATMQHSLSKDQCAVLMREMENETQLTESQLQGIASWLMNWAASDVLRDYVLYHWATGETPRGEKDVSFNLAAHLERLFGFQSSQGVIPSDLFTADSPSLGRLTKTSRRDLWNVQSAGSFVNPNARIVWCTVVPNGDTIQFCPYLLNEFGVVSTSVLTAFKAAVRSSASQEVITKSSNLTKISISFLQTQLGIEESDAIHAIAMWWRRLPETSLFFQVNQLRTWRTSLASVSSDPLRFGYDLGFVFSVNQSVARNASRIDLVANPIVLDGKSSELGACNQSLELNLIFWDPSNAVSFLHPDGIKQWRQFFQYRLDEVEFLEFLTNSPDTSAADTIASTGMTEADVSCTLQSIRNWLASWSQHPFLRQFVEFLWFQSLESTSSSFLSSPLLSDANELLAAFPLDATHRDALSVVMDSDESLSRWANVSQILLDSSQSLAFINADEGFSTWKALLVNCFSSNETSGECQNSSSHALQDYQDHVSTANAAVALLVDSLWSQISNVAKQRAAESKTLDAMIHGRIVPWMIGWLDHPLFERFVLQHVQEVEPSLDIEAISFHDLAMVQFVNASVTRANYTTHTVLEDNGHSNDGEIDAGRSSERSPRQELVFNASQQRSIRQVGSLLPGFAELKSFCELHGRDASFAYDASSTTCKLNADYTVSIEDVSALVAVFSDDTPWVWNASNATASSRPPNSTRAALLLDAFLAQPFTTMRDCDFVVKNIALAFDLAEDQTSESCVQDANSGGIYLDLPMLTSAGFTSKPRAFLTDIQAYLRYAGTKFGYEPSVLGRKPVALSSDGPVPSTASLKYPIGGYIAVTTISDTIFASKANPHGGFWRNDSLARNNEGADSVVLSPSMVVPQQFTMQVPLEHDLKLFKKRNNVVGEILAIDNATEVLVWGMRVVLSGVRVTDGSQFTTLVLATKYTNGGDKFPPQKFLFYWEYARRLVQFEYERNVTRFGASLMRYTVTNWLEPTSLPTGLDESQAALLNMSLLLDDLQFAVGAASPLLTEAANATVDVDPLTGSVCHSRMVWQLSARVQRDAARDVWHNAILDCWLPVAWVQEQASVSARKGLTLASAARGGPFAKEKVAKWEVIGGCVYIVVGAVLSFFYARRARMLKRLLQAQNVLPEQTVCLLDDETLSTSVGSPTQASRQVGDNDAEVTAVRQSLTTVAQSDSSNHRDQLTHLHSSGSRSGRSGRRKTQHIQTIIEQTDGIGDDAESNGGANVSVRT